MSLAEEARKAASLLADHEYVRIVARAGDGDALAAGALLALALEREGVDFHFSTISALDERALARIRDERNGLLVLVDLPEATDHDVIGLAGDVILLHDAVAADAEGALNVTAERADATGGIECASSTLAFAVARAMSKRNVDLAALALAGPLAEGQHATGGLLGLNGEFAAEAVDADALTREAGLALDGASFLEAVAQGVEPYFGGLAGRARQAQRFLKEAGVAPEDAPESLAEASAERAASALTLHLLERGAPDGALGALTAPRWRATSGVLDGETALGLARRFRAAAAAGASGAAVAWLWDREGADADLAAAERAFRESALSSLVRAERELGANGKSVLALVEAPDAASPRGVADLASLSLAPDLVPAVAWADDGDGFVACGRASRARVRRGLDLARAFRGAGVDGVVVVGNRASAWAWGPGSSRDAFLNGLRGSVEREDGA